MSEKELSNSKIIEDILKNNTEWLKYIETKNLFLIGTNIALITVVNKIEFSKNFLQIISISISLLSIFLILLSAKPLTKKIESGKCASIQGLNPFFYADISKLSRSVFFQSIEGLIKRDATDIERHHLASIYNISHIASRKLKFFNHAAIGSFCSISMPLIDKVIIFFNQS